MWLRGENGEGAVFTPQDEVAARNDPMCSHIAGEYVDPYEALATQHQRLKTMSTRASVRSASLSDAGTCNMPDFMKQSAPFRSCNENLAVKRCLKQINPDINQLNQRKNPFAIVPNQKKVRRGIQMLLIERSSEFITQCDLN